MNFFLALLIVTSLVFAPSGFAAENLGEFIFHHLGNSDSWKPLPGVAAIPLPSHFEIFGINMGITLHVFMMLIAVVVMLILFFSSGKRKDLMPTSRFSHAVEAIIIYLRDEVIVPTIGKKDAPKWLPFFLTLFFFILTLNVLGMIPVFSTVTANINFTAAMAIMIFFTYNVAGIIKNGPIHYFTNLVPKGIPIPVLFILAPVELLGLFTKAFALAIRLFANMSAGHIIILSLLGLISLLKSYFVSPFSIAFALFISTIEILVAFLQAYVFTLLASLFVGMAIHQEH